MLEKFEILYMRQCRGKNQFELEKVVEGPCSHPSHWFAGQTWPRWGDHYPSSSRTRCQGLLQVLNRHLAVPKVEEWQMLPEMGRSEEKMLEAFREEHTAFGNPPPHWEIQCASSTITVQIFFEKFSSVRILWNASCSRHISGEVKIPWNISLRRSWEQ